MEVVLKGSPAPKVVIPAAENGYNSHYNFSADGELEELEVYCGIHSDLFCLLFSGRSSLWYRLLCGPMADMQN